jgi:hypothetical protein
MRTAVERTACLAVLAALLAGGVALGQAGGDPPPKDPDADKKPSQLEEMLARAMRDNPDVRVAEAKLREAEAELNRARLTAVQKIVALQRGSEQAQAAVAAAEARYKASQAMLEAAERDHERAIKLLERKQVTKEVVDATRLKVEQDRANLETAKAELQSSKAALAKVQAELPYLLGKQPRGDAGPEAVLREMDALLQRQMYAIQIERAHAAWRLAARQLHGDMADKVRKALDAPVKVQFQEHTLEDILEYLQRVAEVPFLDHTPAELRKQPQTLRLSQPVPLGAALQALEDHFGVRFAVREYGILVADKLPPDMVPLHTFWKGPREAEKAKPPAGGEEKPK